MPCIYAHDSFGKKVTKRLPEEIQLIIKKYPNEFQIGLQGPDFLFFYHPLMRLRTNRIGYWQHSHTMSSFIHDVLPTLKKTGTDNGAYSYFLGFICHFVLDSECHSYVIPTSERPGYSHLTIENEFDRYLMDKEGHPPIPYPIWRKITWDEKVVDAIYQIYHPFHLSKKKINDSLKGMRFYKRLFATNRSIRRFFIRMAMRISLRYKELEGHMLTIRPKKYAKETNAALQGIFDKSIPLADSLIRDFHLSVTEDKPMNKRFNTTFKNNTIIEE